MAEEAFNAQPPTDPFRIESRIAFRQVFLNPERRGESIAGDAEKMLRRLSVAGSGVDIGRLGGSNGMLMFGWLMRGQI